MQDFLHQKYIAEVLGQGAGVRQQLLHACADDLGRAVGFVIKSLREGGKVLLFGNGGSAADAQHIAAELTGRFQKDREAFAAIALTTDTSALTAISNDHGFEEVYARQVRGLGRPGDVAVGISTSGNSPNVLKGITTAREMGLTTIGLTGMDGGKLAQLVDVAIVAPSKVTAFIQECHIALGHVLCGIVEIALTGDASDVTHIARENGRELIPADQRVVDLESLLLLRERWRRENKQVVWTNGCFDLLHVGHVRNLEAAARLGDVLVVGINSDASVRRIKGPDRPLLPADERAEMIAALQCVDQVVVFDESTPEVILSRLQPDIHCKGEDYRPPDGKPIPEADVVAAYGGKIVFLPLIPGRSTTSIIRQIREHQPTEQSENPDTP